MATILGAGKAIMYAADKLCERIPDEADRRLVYGAAGLAAVAVDPVGTTVEVCRQIIRDSRK